MASAAMTSSMVAVSQSTSKACTTRTTVVANARALPILARPTARLSQKSAWTAVRASKPHHNFIARASRHQIASADAEVTTQETSSDTTPSERERRPRREVTVQQEDVAVGNKYTGTVTSVQSYGAFVNFGAKSDGLVHISELTTGFVENVGDVVTQGQEVQVRVLSVDVKQNRVALTMKEESASPASGGTVEMVEGGRPVRRGKVATRGKREGGPRDNTPPPVKKGEKYMGVVKSLLPFGAFVELKLEGVEGVQGLLHVSEISEERIQDPSTVLAEEQEVEVRVLAVNGSKLNLSMREQVDIAELNAAANEDLGETFSVLELALKKAGIKSENFPKGEAKSTTAQVAADSSEQSAPETKAVEPAPEPEVVEPESKPEVIEPESKPEAVESAPEPEKEAPKTEESAPAGVTISASMVKDLRSMSGAGMMDCKKALQETGGDVELAAEWLRKKGMASADKKASRIAAEGAVGAYIHAGSRIGVLVEVNCETDFVAKGDVFKGIVADVAMQIAACPTVEFVSTDDVPADFVAKEKAIEMGKEDLQSKPENIREKMVEGRIAKLLKEKALLEQSFIKDGDKTVDQFIKENIAAIGEKISIRRFERFNLGEGLEKRTEDFAAEVAAQTQVKQSVPKPENEEPKEEPKEDPAKPAVKVDAKSVKELRSISGAGMMDCKKALQETEGDVEKASEWLRKKGMASADKKASRIAAEGGVGCYIHAGSRIGVLVEVNCETDFVAKGDVFKGILADVAMQIAACPTVEFVSTDDVPAEFVAKEKAIEMGKEDLQSKPENIREKMVEGRIAKLLKEKALLEQPYIKDSDKTVEQFIKENVAAIGEKISIRRFQRFNLGEGLEKRNEDFAAEVAAQMGK